MTPITLDFSNMVRERLGAGGIDPERLGGDLADRFRTAHEQVEASRRSGEMGFFELPYDSDGLGHAQELADRLKERFENLVIIGIGGSALAPGRCEMHCWDPCGTSGRMRSGRAALGCTSSTTWTRAPSWTP